MEKILIRGGISPIDSFNPSKIIARNLFGSNVGNLIYQFGVFRTLATENIQAIPDNYSIERGLMTNQDIAKINKNYDAYVCPLADAMRRGFTDKLDLYVKFVEKLDIPFVVAGIGLRTNIRDDGTKNFSFDENVANFIRAVNENGNIVGLRGNTTGNYLSNLGFKKNKDFMVIGCPSMFSYGTHVKIQEKEINKNSLISINSSFKARKPTLKFISNLFEQYPNHYFIPQWLRELKLTYLGVDMKVRNETKREFYPTRLGSSEYQNNNVRFPVDAYGWISLLETVDFSFGTRLHGNIAATIAGTPNIIVVKDGRMKDVVDYHELTNIRTKQLRKYDSLEKVIESVDFHSTEKNHEKRFKNYLNFWEKNNIQTIYDDDFYRKDSPIDKKIKLSSKMPVETISNLSQIDINMRLKEYRNERKKWRIEKIQRLKKINFYIKAPSIIKKKIYKFVKNL